MQASQENLMNTSRGIHSEAVSADAVPPSTASLNHSIPLEIWIEVFCVLYSSCQPWPPHDRRRLHPLLPSMLVCRHWNSIIASTPILWSFMYLDFRYHKPQRITDLCERYSARLEGSTAILDLTIRLSKNVRIDVVRWHQNWDIALSFLSNAVRSLVLVSQSYRYQAIQCPHLEIVRIVGSNHINPCVLPGLGEASSKVQTLCLDGVSPSRLENIKDWTGLIQHLVSTAEWGSIADIESAVSMFPQVRSVHMTIHEFHGSLRGSGNSASEFLEGLAIHFVTDWCGGLDRAFTVMRGMGTLKVLSIAWAFTESSGSELESLNEAHSSSERHLQSQTFPFQSLQRFIQCCKDCRLSRFALFLDANSAEMAGLRDLIFQESLLERVSELVLGAHADRTYDHYTMPWRSYATSGLLSKVVCHPAYLPIAVDAILGRYSTGSCASCVRLEILGDFDYNHYGMSRLFLPEEEANDLQKMPDAESINPELLAAGEKGLRVDCIYRNKIIQSWNTSTH